MRKQLLALFASGMVLTACDQSKVDCEGGCEGPIVFKECVRDTIYFDFDKSNVKASEHDKVAEQAKWMGENECATATLTGHADRRGTNAYNMALGDRRANSHKTALVGMGVDGARLSTASKGEMEATGNHPMDRKSVMSIDADGVPETPY